MTQILHLSSLSSMKNRHAIIVRCKICCDLYVKYYASHFIPIISFNPHNKPVRKILLLLFHSTDKETA